MAPKRRPANGANTCQTAPSRPSAADHAPARAGGPRGTEARAGIAVKDLVEQQIITEVRVPLLHRRFAEDRPTPVPAAKEHAAQPAGKLDGDFAEMQHGPGSYRAFDLEIVA